MSESLSRRSLLAGAATAAVASALPGQANALPSAGDDSLTAIGKRLRYARERAGMSIEQAAIAIGAGPAEWAIWESPLGDDGLPFIEGIKCCELLGTGHEWMCQGEDCDEAPGIGAKEGCRASKLFGVTPEWLIAGENS